MEKIHPRLRRELETIEKMMHLYCRQVHGSPPGPVCSECAALMAYAASRLERCPFQGEKPTCARCKVHCYKPPMRESVRVMMRYSGPRMLTHHPLLAIYHFIDGLRRPPTLEGKNKRRA